MEKEAPAKTNNCYQWLYWSFDTEDRHQVPRGETGWYGGDAVKRPFGKRVRGKTKRGDPCGSPLSRHPTAAAVLLAGALPGGLVRGVLRGRRRQLLTRDAALRLDHLPRQIVL